MLNIIKSFILTLVPPIILIFYQKLKAKPKYYGLNNLDQKISKILNYDNGFYIELGANNGIEQSNTLYFEKERNWKGILVEPILHKYLQCKKNRSQKNYFYNNACVSFEFDDPHVKLLYSNLMTTSTNLESDIINKFEHANFSNTQRKEKIDVLEFLAIPKTLNSILINSSAPKLIDLLSLDVEGAELEVLKGIDFKMFNFKYMLIECRDISKVSNFLKSKNYISDMKLSPKDYLFKYKV